MLQPSVLVLKKGAATLDNGGLLSHTEPESRDVADHAHGLQCGTEVHSSTLVSSGWRLDMSTYAFGVRFGIPAGTELSGSSSEIGSVWHDRPIHLHIKSYRVASELEATLYECYGKSFDSGEERTECGTRVYGPFKCPCSAEGGAGKATETVLASLIVGCGRHPAVATSERSRPLGLSATSWRSLLHR